MPPAIQSRIQVSAVGRGCSMGSAAQRRGSPAARVATAAALMPRRKSRRVRSCRVMNFLPLEARVGIGAVTPVHLSGLADPATASPPPDRHDMRFLATPLKTRTSDCTRIAALYRHEHP